MQFRKFVEDQVISPTLIANALRTTRSEIAGTLGLGQDALSRKTRIRARKTQTRLREMLEILNRAEAETGSPIGAYAWFRSEPLAGFGGMTPRPAGARWQGQSCPCVSRPCHGRRLRVSLLPTHALRRAGVPRTRSAVVMDSSVRRRSARPRRTLQPTRYSVTQHLACSVDRHTRGPALGSAHPSILTLCVRV